MLPGCVPRKGPLKHYEQPLLIAACHVRVKIVEDFVYGPVLVSQASLQPLKVGTHKVVATPQ